MDLLIFFEKTSLCFGVPIVPIATRWWIDISSKIKGQEVYTLFCSDLLHWPAFQSEDGSGDFDGERGGRGGGGGGEGGGGGGDGLVQEILSTLSEVRRNRVSFVISQKRCCQAFLPELFWIPKYTLSSEVCGTCLRSRTPLCPPRSSLSSRSPSSSSPRSACASTPCHLSSGIILTRWRCWTACFGWLGKLPNVNLHFVFGPKKVLLWKSWSRAFKVKVYEAAGSVCNPQASLQNIRKTLSNGTTSKTISKVHLETWERSRTFKMWCNFRNPKCYG